MHKAVFVVGGILGGLVIPQLYGSAVKTVDSFKVDAVCTFEPVFIIIYLFVFVGKN